MNPLFYLRDSRDNVGSTCMFWADRGGYTSNLDLAEVFTLEEAQRQFNSRHTDVPLSKELVDEQSTVRVDHQYLGDEGEKSGCDEYVIRIGDRTDGNDVYWLTVDFSSVSYKASVVFTYQVALVRVNELKTQGIVANIYAKTDIDAIARRTFQAANINERSMITAAGIRKPKRPRTRQTTGKTRGNCPHCGCITWGLNPYEAYSCADQYSERMELDFTVSISCEELKARRKAA
ncbi:MULTISPECIES: hypothetical protein [Shewanella]|uniref:Uncharacterized protein n=2 Tax=Shewanella TaxID=22 RepID=A9KZS5_SHEB9|nr:MULTISPECIES: hypothetical protein [Shewanella]ABX49177.1 conserved hypothetical protein [Shewanella baltica OS195]ADT94165.1 hypothetical protein Sbal678_2004 [Shewanella baltica OS678]MDT3279920.1 hypothetical protein [Shewanella sp. SP2S1-2]